MNDYDPYHPPEVEFPFQDADGRLLQAHATFAPADPEVGIMEDYVDELWFTDQYGEETDVDDYDRKKAVQKAFKEAGYETE